MESLSLEEENIIKDIGSLFRQEKETKSIKDRILRDIKTFLDKYHRLLDFHMKKVINKEQQQSYENPKVCDICLEKFENRCLKDKKYRKVRDNCRYTGEHRGAAHSICILKYSVSKKFPIVFIMDQTMIIILS